MKTRILTPGKERVSEKNSRILMYKPLKVCYNIPLNGEINAKK